jgi:hypothetical protein
MYLQHQIVTLMNRLFTIACSVAMLNIFLPCHAQTQDTALARIDESKKTAPDQQKEGLISETMDPLKSGSEKAEEMAPKSKFVLPMNPDNRNSADWILKHKAGPSGEELLIEDDMYYYINGEGTKIKVDPAEFEDNAKSS